MKRFLSHISLLLVLVVISIGSFVQCAQAQVAPGAILINEVMLDGTQWIEIMNTTASDINLSSSTWLLVSSEMGPGGSATTTLSGLIPAYGLVTLAPTSTLATSSFETLLSIMNSGTTTPIYTMSYGGPAVQGELNLGTFPSAGQSIVLTGQGMSAALSATTSISKGWFNETVDPIPDCENPPVPGEGLPVTLHAISVCLDSLQGVITNMGSTTLIADPTAAAGLYFEKTGKGRITYGSALNLTDQNNRTLLQAIGTKLKMNHSGRFGLNAASSTIMKNLGATLSIFGLSTLGYDSSLGTSSLLVRDDSDIIIPFGSSTFPVMTDVSWDAGNNGTLTFNASHFSDYGPSPVVTEITPVPTPTASTSPSYTFNSNVAGTVVYGGDCSMSPASTTVGNNDVVFGPLTPATYSNCTVSVIDGAGASSTLAVSTFIVTDTAADTAAVAADKASLVAGLIQGANTDLSHITVHLTDPLPSVGSASSSVISWVSASTSLVSNNGQTVNRPAYGQPNATTTLTATITKGVITDTSVFNITVLASLPSATSTVTSATYTVNDGAGTITNIPFGTASSTFVTGLTKGESHQTWDVSNLTSPVVTGNTLIVTAQDATTTKTYTLTVALNPAKSITGFTIPSQVGTTTINEVDHTITIVMPNDTDVTTLVPTITTTGSSTSPATGEANDFTSTSTYTVTALDASTQDYTVSVTVLSSTQTAPDDSGDASIGTTTPQVVITNPDQAVTITLDDGVSDPSIDVSAFITNGTGTVPSIALNSSVADLTIATSTTITSASTSWDGVIAAPTVTTVTLPTTSGYTKTLSTAIEVGFTGVQLSFDKGVRILLPGQAGKRVGYVRTGIDFTEITAVCSADNQTTGDALAADAECKIDVGSDLVIWTKHFTTFAAYSQAVSVHHASISYGDVGGSYTTPVVATTTATTTTSVATSTTATSTATTTVVLTVSNPTLELTVSPTTFTSGYKFSNDLKVGSRGTDVTELQKRLTSEGVYSGEISGYYGVLTKAAVKAYQLKNGLPQPGIVGPQTREKLNNKGGMSINDFVNFLINLGIISPDKVILLKSILPALGN